MKEFDEYDEIEERSQGESQSINLKPFLGLALRNWKIILLWAFAGALIGVIIGVSTPKTYSTKAVVAPEITTRSSLGGGLSSLASLAGVNMNSLALTDAMHPDLYPEIIQSTNFYISLFDLPVDVQVKDSLIHTDLYDYVANYWKSPWWGYVFGLPRMAIEGIKSVFKRTEDYDDSLGHSSLDSLRLTKQQEKVIKILSKNIDASVEKRTFVLSLRVTMQDRIIAAQLANAAIDQLQKFVVNYRTGKIRENVEYYEQLYKESHEEYLAAQREYAYYADSHLGSVSQASKIHLQHLQNEAQLKYQMHMQTAQNLLSTKAKLQQESPVLVVIQPGIAPHDGKPSKVKLTIMWFFVGALLCLGYLSWRKS